MARPTNSFQQAFQNATLRNNFSLNLSQSMIEYLCAVAGDVRWDRTRYGNRGAPENWRATEGALERRGMIVHKPQEVRERLWKKAVAASHVEFVELLDHSSKYTLTPIGKAVVRVLVEAGMFVKGDIAHEKTTRKRS